MRRYTARLLALMLPVLAAIPAADLPGTLHCSWIGNSLPGGNGWVPQGVADLAVASDGAVYTNIFWEEGGANQTEIRNGQVVRSAGGSRGWGHEGGDAVAVNSQYLYYAQRYDNEGGGLVDAQQWPPAGFTWYGVSRRRRSDIRSGPAFAGGKGGKESAAGCFLPVHQSATALPITGLAANDAELFVAIAGEDRVRVYDAATMQAKRNFPVTRPGRLALDGAGTLWVASADGTTVLHLAADGTALPQSIALTAPARAGDIVIDRDGRLLVADTGPDAQVLVYDNLVGTPRLAQRLGVTGGVLAGPVAGRTGTQRFNTICGLGADAAGNVVVASGQQPFSGVVLESWSPAGALNWQLVGLEFVDRLAEDPADHTRLYSRETCYAVDWSRPPGGEAAYHALTVDLRRFPEDPRSILDLLSPQIARIAGQRFLAVTGQNGADRLAILRFDAAHGEVAIPCALFSSGPAPAFAQSPAGGGWLWRDGDGDGRPQAGEFQSQPGGGNLPGAGGTWIDANGDVWFAGGSIRRHPCQGLDARGVPRWDLAQVQSFPAPAPLDAARRLRYDAASDTLYVGGTDPVNRNMHWKGMGPRLVRYDGWLRGARTRRWDVLGPIDTGYRGGHVSCEPISFDVAGDYVFVSLAGASQALGIGWAAVEVYRAVDGVRVGRMVLPPQFGQTGLMDMVECLRAFRRADGEYVVMLEDDLKAKNLVYRWMPLPGDADLSGAVDAADLGLVRGQLGRSGDAVQPAAGDMNGDGRVDAADLGTVTRALGL